MTVNQRYQRSHLIGNQVLMELCVVTEFFPWYPSHLVLKNRLRRILRSSSCPKIFSTTKVEIASFVATSVRSIYSHRIRTVVTDWCESFRPFVLQSFGRCTCPARGVAPYRVLLIAYSIFSAVPSLWWRNGTPLEPKILQRTRFGWVRVRHMTFVFSTLK